MIKLEKLTINLSAETTEIEFKEEIEYKKPKSWLKTVSAFSNGIGGTIYFGVNDNREIIGLEDVQKHIEKISELIKTHMGPWTKDKLGNKVLEYPKTDMQKFVHMCDYLSSKKFLNVEFSGDDILY